MKAELGIRGFDQLLLDGQELLTFSGQAGEVGAIRHNANGSLLTTANLNAIFQLWNVRTGTLLRTKRGSKADVMAVALSPRARFALTGNWDRTMRLWDTTIGREDRAFTGHTGAVRAVAFSADGKRVISGSMDTTARVWDPNTGKLIATLKGHETQVTAVALNESGQHALTADLAGTTILWDVAKARPIYHLIVDREGGYAAWNAKRALAGSVKGLQKNMHLVQGNNTYPIGPTLNRYYKPGALRTYAPPKSKLKHVAHARPTLEACAEACANMLKRYREHVEARAKARGQVLKKTSREYQVLERMKKTCPKSCIIRAKPKEVMCIRDAKTYPEALNCLRAPHPAIRETKVWADKVCACTTIACTKALTKAFMRRLWRLFRKKRPTSSDNRQIRQHAKRAVRCMMRLRRAKR